MVVSGLVWVVWQVVGYNGLRLGGYSFLVAWILDLKSCFWGERKRDGMESLFPGFPPGPSFPHKDRSGDLGPPLS